LKSRQGWKRPFDDPIPLPRGRQLVTLEGRRQLHHRASQGRAFRTRVAGSDGSPDAALMLVATRGGPTMLARIGVMQALHRHIVREFQLRSQRHALGKAEAETG
jgi:hypothetical protein